MRVFTYFQQDPLLANNGFDVVLDIWRHRWTAAGFEPVVLGLEDAQKHPDFNKVLAHVAGLPTVNPVTYELACWMRWLAMEHMADQHGGSILAVDSDVIPNGRVSIPATTQTTCLDAGGVPCAVVVHPGHSIKWMINGFSSAHGIMIHGHRQCSDMIMFQQSSVPRLDVCREFAADGWLDAPLVHFATTPLAKAGFSKVSYADAVKLLPSRVYLAGPMTGIPRWNFDLFLQVGAELSARGYIVANPAQHDLDLGFDPDAGTQPSPSMLKTIMAWDVDQVMHCDLVVALPGWAKSTGAVAEVALAQWRGVPVLEWPCLSPAPKITHLIP